MSRLVLVTCRPRSVRLLIRTNPTLPILRALEEMGKIFLILLYAFVPPRLELAIGQLSTETTELS